MKKILVANRGEIALRIMRSAREMGIATVAVYSDADRKSPHVRFADEAYLLGPPPSSESYLLGDKLIDICLDNGADGIHPGYGFLSENATFARKVKEAGITFIGPSADSMELMGSKLASKAAVKNFGVPLVPGTAEAIDDVEAAKLIAAEIGFPVLIKASAGGGGKGMRIVNSVEEFAGQMERASSEAEKSFGDGSVFIEKYVAGPRHIEIQVIGDKHGNTVHLFERECSIQRRHQKVIEEAPSAILSPALRAKMGAAAINVCRSCNYYNAGTVEFLMDENEQYYFLEMNTRLQVEHPVTEMITGVDLVKEQIRVAMGLPLSFTQDDLEIRGHSIELRICAEDPANNFLPDTGKLVVYRRPQGNGVRVDDGYEEGMDIPVYYDPLLAKLVVHGSGRSDAISRMRRAIAEFDIAGIETTLPFGDFVMRHPAFLSGDFDTHFVQDHFDSTKLYAAANAGEEAVAAVAAALAISKLQPESSENRIVNQKSNWQKNRS